MKKTFFVSLAILATVIVNITSCKTSSSEGETTDSTATASAGNTAAGDNVLSDEDKKIGFALLFDGKSMDGWRTYQSKNSNSWSVKDGVLYCKGDSTNKSDMRADLITQNEYENFDFWIDWKISPQGNSGIIYLATENEEAAYLSGPEYQIIDDKNFPEKLEAWQMTGANYAMNPAPAADPKPVGEWNTSRIVKLGNHVEHWLNGKKIVEYEIGSDEWKKNKAEGKWKDAPNYGTAAKGHFALQDHGSEAWFKNIKIKVM